jgi:hypothetical protein
LDEIDAAPVFAPLFERLASVADARGYNDPAVYELVAACAAEARRAGVLPETVIAHLRRRVHETPLGGVGDWYRPALAERLINRAVVAYFAGAPDTPAPE